MLTRILNEYSIYPRFACQASAECVENYFSPYAQTTIKAKSSYIRMFFKYFKKIDDGASLIKLSQLQEWALFLCRNKSMSFQAVTNYVFTVVDYLNMSHPDFSRIQERFLGAKYLDTLRRHVRLLAERNSVHKAPPFGLGVSFLLPRELFQLLVFWFLSGLRASSFQCICPDDVIKNVEEGYILLRVRSIKNKRLFEGPFQAVYIFCNCCPAHGDEYCPIHGFEIPDFPQSRYRLAKLVYMCGLSLHSPRRALAVAIWLRLESDPVLRASLTLTEINRIFLWATNSMSFFNYVQDAVEYRGLSMLPVEGVIRRRSQNAIVDMNQDEDSDSDSEQRPIEPIEVD